MKLMRPAMISDMAKTRVAAFDGNASPAGPGSQGLESWAASGRCGQAVASVSGWERNTRTPEPATLVALAQAVDLDPGELLGTPRTEWGLAEFRVTRGLQQREVAKAIGMNPVRFSYIEAAYERPAERCSPLWPSSTASEQEIIDAWERTRARLTADVS